jgi:8-oxo-dGTP pyrophosphatase MutT (NUDIX family)
MNDPMPSHPPLRPSDAATLIILRRDGDDTRVLMGKRHSEFRLHARQIRLSRRPGRCRRLPAQARGRSRPGGRRQADGADARAALAGAGPRPCHGGGARDLRGSGTDRRHANHGPPRTRSNAWRAFLDTGYAPDLRGLRYFARAITPPGRPRRFDTRFFVLDAVHVVNAAAPAKVTEELLDPCWLRLDEAAQLELPNITKDILTRLKATLEVEDREALQPRSTPAVPICPGEVLGYRDDLGFVGWRNTLALLRPTAGTRLT